MEMAHDAEQRPPAEVPIELAGPRGRPWVEGQSATRPGGRVRRDRRPSSPIATICGRRWLRSPAPPPKVRSAPPKAIRWRGCSLPCSARFDSEDVAPRPLSDLMRLLVIPAKRGSRAYPGAGREQPFRRSPQAPRIRGG